MLMLHFNYLFSNHSAENLISNCSVQKCNGSNNTSGVCRSSSTPCFEYRAMNNISYCAPGILCTILEPCDNITYTCTSNQSICVVNSCCTSQAICLPLFATNFCKKGNDN